MPPVFKSSYQYQNTQSCDSIITTSCVCVLSSEDRRGLQGVPGRAQPQTAAFVHAGVVPDQTHPESAEIPSSAERTALAHRPRQRGALPSER